MIRTRNFCNRNTRTGHRGSNHHILRYLQIIFWLGTVHLATGCGGPKEAENPRDLLGEDLNHGGVYGGGTAPDTPGAPPEEPEQAAKPGARKPGDPASSADCARAADHLVKLGIDLAIREETDQGKKQQMLQDREAALHSERAETHRKEWARECLERGTTVREAECIAKIRRELDIDACVGGP